MNMQAIPDFIKSLKESGVSADVISEAFVKSGCTLEVAVLAKDPEVTHCYLTLKNSIDDHSSQAAIKSVLDPLDMDNLRVLLTYGPDVKKRKKYFANECVSKIKFLYPSLLFEDWSAFGNNYDTYDIQILDKPEMPFFLNSNKYKTTQFEKKVLQKFLADRNRQIVELLDVMKVTLIPGTCMFYHMYTRNLLDYFKFSVDVSNYPYSFVDGDYILRTKNVELIEILLRAGLLNVVARPYLLQEFPLLQPILAQLAINKAKNIPIKQEIYNAVTLEKYQQEFYVKCQKQIDWMKSNKVCESLMLFDVINMEVESLAQRSLQEEAISNSLQCCKEHQVIDYYYRILEDKLNTALATRELFQSRPARFIAEWMQLNNSTHLVVVKIMSFLSQADLLNLSLTIGNKTSYY